MTNLVTVLRRAVEQLEENNEQARAAIYARAKSALEAQLRGLDPPLPPEALERQIADLDAAVAQVEAEYAEADDAEPTDPAVSAIERELGAFEPHAGAAPGGEQEAVSGSHETFRSAVAQTAELGNATSEAARSARSAFEEFHDHADAEAFHATGDGDGPGLSRVAQDGSEGAPAHEPFPAHGGHPTAQPDDFADDYESGGRGVGIAMWAIVFLMIAGIAGAAFWQREALTEVVMSFSAGEAEVVEVPAEDKIEERVPAADAGEAATADETRPPAGEARAPEPALPQQTRVAQALLVEEGPENSLSSLSGSVDWALLDDPEAPPEAAKVIRGTVQIPDKNMTLTLAIRRNTDPDLPASHTVELLFDVPNNFENGGIAGVAGLVMKATPQSSGQPLIGAVVPVTDEFYLLGLSESEFDRARNIDELRRRNFIDIPIVYADEGRAILSIAKGESGNQVFREAFETWGY